MLLQFVWISCVAVIFARPQGPGAATIVKYESERYKNGYSFDYETSDGVRRSERGTLTNSGSDNEIMVVQGTVIWTGADGKKYTINYIADDNG